MGNKAIKMKDVKGNNVYPCPYYPIGSIYISVTNINPSTFFGGTWEEIKGRFLVGRGCPSANSDNYFGDVSGIKYNIQAGTTGGQDYHTLTTEEMPSHTHTTGIQGDRAGAMSTGDASAYVYFNQYMGLSTTPSGGNSKHNNMPPYLGVYMWQRTA